MPKFVIRETAPKPGDAPVELYLKRLNTGEMLVKAIKSGVLDQCIAYLRPDGTLALPSGIDPAFGFQLDAAGRIKLNSKPEPDAAALELIKKLLHRIEFPLLYSYGDMTILEKAKAYLAAHGVKP